ncbi:MAG TPA: Smr/MutS family protein [Candidatus Cloacimonadota bacterium]|nr:Smr/MutS family protein [Candidatus Cloacimonadota bacterium]HPT72388.1 Smr/MutS family protein [Candidatus Cloacimonadota bacterium]
MYSYHSLEFNKVKDLIISECHSEFGRQLSDSLLPLTVKKDILSKQSLIGEIQELLREGTHPSLEDLHPLVELFDEFEGQTFNYEEFRMIYETTRIANSIAERKEEFSKRKHFYQLINGLKAFPGITARFVQIFDSEGEILDSASPALKQIRRQQRSVREDIIKTLNRKFQDNQFEKFVQEKIVTQRENRYVIPVKESNVAFVPGIVQGHSGSRSSVYMEPQEVVGMNNQLNLLQDEEKREIFRILKEYTGDILPLQEDIIQNTLVLQKVDFHFACGCFCNRMKAQSPHILDEPRLHLLNARHPLLISRLNDFQKVIPFELELGKDFRVLVLSGPNTGGKTVTLKTVGLLSMMALAGLPIPADEDSEIGIFHHIMADIGDDQSLENALSTFSSHVMKIKDMMENADSASLILIDEIGAATDPEQGSALGQAIMEKLTEKKVIGVITTHYTALKVFAEQHPDCTNAAMQFDAKKHIPTYHFQLGLPGDSFAIEVASSLGLDTALIERAKHLAGSQNVEFTELLKKMVEQKKDLSRTEYQHQLQIKLLEGKISEYEKKLAGIDQEQKEIRKRSLSEAKEYILTLQKELNKELEEIRHLEKDERKQKADKLIHRNLESLDEITKEENELDPSVRISLKQVSEGQKVLLDDFDAIVTVAEVNGDDVVVDMNGIRFKTKLNKLFKVNQKQEKPDTLIRISSRPTKVETKSATFELKILGNTFDEAQPKIDEFIDSALHAGLHKLRIVHGKGTGALRTKVRSYLKRHKHVMDINTPPSEAGGDGVTVVTIG